MLRALTTLPRAVRALSTSAAGPLTASQIESFRTHGFLVVRDLLTSEEKKDLQRWTDEITDLPVVKGKYMHYYERALDGEKKLCRIENFVNYHAIEGLVKGKVQDGVGQLLGEPALLYKDKINYKLPQGNGYRAHQDAPAYPHVALNLTALIAGDSADMSNGCLEAVSATKTGLDVFPHPQPSGSIPDEVTQQWDGMWEPIVVSPGDVCFFSSLVVHRSGDNLSDRSRRTYYLTFNAASLGDKHAQYYADKRREFPPENEREAGKDYSEGAKVYNLANPVLND